LSSLLCRIRTVCFLSWSFVVVFFMGLDSKYVSMNWLVVSLIECGFYAVVIL
jgi:hypothetical protein